MERKRAIGWKASLGTVMAVVGGLLAFAAPVAHAASDCIFADVGTTRLLTNDCTTDGPIPIPDGFTLDGQGHTITAVDPPGGHFQGAVVRNAGSVAHVTRLTVRAAGLGNVCDAGDDRLRGIMFEGASGSIGHTTVLDINQGASGCQEGNAIEVRNAPFDGSHPSTVSVEIAHNQLDDWQKTGIVANGDVHVSIHHNFVGDSATQANLAPNGVQLGFGAIGDVQQNHVEGNQWLGASDFAGTAILVFFADSSIDVSNNNIDGNADVGIYWFSGNGAIDNNRVFDFGSDGPHGDFGIINCDLTCSDPGAGTVTNNKVLGYDVPYFLVEDGRNKTIGGPNNPVPGTPQAF